MYEESNIYIFGMHMHIEVLAAWCHFMGCVLMKCLPLP